MRTTACLTAAMLLVACKNDRGDAGADDDGTDSAPVTTGTPTTSSATNETQSATGSETGDSADTIPGPIYDVNSIPDVPGTECGNGGGKGGGGNPGDPLLSYIWISNSTQGTVSKIDTVTLEEVGRYVTRPDGIGDPSRTSVNLNGDVAVANRNGGLVKFYANEADCEDRNGNGHIETSDGPDNVLDYDEEECRAWFTPFDYLSQRPVAWTAGEWNPDECRYEHAKVWTAGASDNWGTPGDFEGVHVVLVNGDNGDVEHAVKIPEVIPSFYGIYGGAVDADGNFWGSQLSSGHLVNVDLQTQEYRLWTMGASGYGMTVDHTGYVWVCSYQVGRFDPETETWQSATVNGSGGCMEDGEGTLWLASNPLVGVDIETLEVVATHPLPEYVHGVSIDFEGYVWGVSMNTAAYKVNRETGEYDVVNGLVGPYTYSDMTGFALSNAGGWIPSG